MTTFEKFKSIIMFRNTMEQSLELKSILIKIPRVKVLTCQLTEEVKQIVEMSEKTAILIDDMKNLDYFFKQMPSMLGLYRIYLINWNSELSSYSLKKIELYPVTIIEALGPGIILEKLELYFLGELSSKKGLMSSLEDLAHPIMHSYLTHLELTPDTGWRMLVSSHEREESISSILEKNWAAFLKRALKRAPKILEPEEVRLRLHHQMIYPHMADGKTHKMSIVHIRLDEQIELNIKRVKHFLGKI